MNIKKTTATITALSFIAAVTLTACGHDPLMDDEIEKPEPVTIWEHTTEEYTEEETTEEVTTEPATEPNKNGLGTGGDTFTVLGWNPYDAPLLIATWLGADLRDVKNGEDLETPDGVGVNFISLDISGYDAYDNYDRLFNRGDDIDVYLCEPDWALKLLNDDSRSYPIEELGISEAEIYDMYPYTLEQCRNSSGVLKALAYDASPGCFAYNAELAKEYLGAETPEEMQSLVSDWDRFTEAAENVADKSKGKVSLADSLGGMWQAYKSGFTSPLVIGNKPIIGDEVREFADMAKKLWDCGGVSANGQWTDDWYMAGQKGSTMGYFVPAWGFESGGFGIESTSGDTLGKWALCEGPQAYWWGGTLLAVNPATDNGDEACDFLYASAVDVGGLMELAEQSSYLPNSELVTEFLIDEGFIPNDLITKNYTNGEDYLSILDRNAKGVDLSGKITPYDADISAIMYSAIEEKYLKQGESWEDTVAYMQDSIAASYPELD